MKIVLISFAILSVGVLFIICRAAKLYTNAIELEELCDTRQGEV